MKTNHIVFKTWWGWVLFLVIYGIITIELEDYRHGVKQQLKRYKTACHNDSIPAYSRVVSRRLTLLEVQEDSSRMSAMNRNVTYSLGKTKGAFPKYILVETSKIYNHKQPTLQGFETWLKK